MIHVHVVNSIWLFDQGQTLARFKDHVKSQSHFKANNPLQCDLKQFYNVRIENMHANKYICTQERELCLLQNHN